MSPVVEVLIVVAANVLGAAMSLPQAARLIRTRAVAGVSLTWAAMSVVINLWWLAYGVGAGNLAIVPVAVVSAGGYLVIIVALLAFGGAAARHSSVAPVLGVAALPAAGLVLGGWAVTGIVLGVGYGVQLAPAVAAALRTRDPHGISAGTWALALIEALLWGIYGAPRGDAGLTALAVTGVVMSSVVLFRLGQTKVHQGAARGRRVAGGRSRPAWHWGRAALHRGARRIPSSERVPTSAAS